MFWEHRSSARKIHSPTTIHILSYPPIPLYQLSKTAPVVGEQRRGEYYNKLLISAFAGVKFSGRFLQGARISIGR